VHLRLFCKSRLLPASAPAMIYVFVGIGVPLGAVVNGVFLFCYYVFVGIGVPWWAMVDGVCECEYGWFVCLWLCLCLCL